MKVLNLRCAHGHAFEGWFGSADNYESQQSRGLVTCPVCGSSEVIKKLSAPRLNLGHGVEPGAGGDASASESRPVAAPTSTQLARLQAEAIRHIRNMVRNTDNVGAAFAVEARRMHEGEVEERAIRGTATLQERQSLAEDGIVVMPIPDFLDDDRLQ